MMNKGYKLSPQDIDIQTKMENDLRGYEGLCEYGTMYDSKGNKIC